MKITFGLVVAVALMTTALTARSNDKGVSKIDPMLLSGKVEISSGFLVFMNGKGDISKASKLKTKQAKGAFVYETLRSLAVASQLDLLLELRTIGVEHRPFWIVNAIWVRGDRELMLRLSKRSDVRKIAPNPMVKNDLPKSEVETSNEVLKSKDIMPWGIIKIKAPDVWDLGITGENAVIAGADTGYDWEHPAIKGKYRGFDGENADHDYNWHDAVHEDGGLCPADSKEPCDDSDHGTHTMGTMVGDDGEKYKIGVAPGAKWIGCRNMGDGMGTPARYIECYEFFVAPYPVNGDPQRDGDPSKAPHVISNSWTCIEEEGCDSGTLIDVAKAVRAAGIVDVAAVGNEGPDCSTAIYPPGIYEEVFSVGATNESDEITDFSSLGPVTVDKSDRLKPDVSAPGRRVLSCVPGGKYRSMSGTSMACPHVSGLVALLISAEPDLAGDVDKIEEIIKLSALPLTSDIECGDYKKGAYPNPIFGYGRIDAKEAVEYLDIKPDKDGGVDGGEEDTDSDSDSDTETDSDTEIENSGNSGCSCLTVGSNTQEWTGSDLWNTIIAIIEELI